MMWRTLFIFVLLLGVLIGFVAGIFVTMFTIGSILGDVVSHVGEVNVVLNETKLIETLNETIEHWTRVGEAMKT